MFDVGGVVYAPVRPAMKPDKNGVALRIPASSMKKIAMATGFQSKTARQKDPEPIKDRHAVHSMDHGVVWISYRPNLSAAAIDELRRYAGERYIIVSPYPGLDAPVVATAWRVQLKLDGAEDPRLRQFVDQFRISEISPLSGNKCVGGAGDPEPVG